jgi:hypothetical protein
MLKFLILTSFLLNILLFALVINMRREISILNKLRLGYEKKYNSFRIRYTILSRMEDELPIINNLKLLNKPIYIYGDGIIGKKLFGLTKKIPELQVLGFLEGKGEKDLKENLNKDAVVIITPVFDYNKIVELLSNQIDKLNILSIDDLFIQREWSK